MVKKNACIFISGKGTNLKNLINCSRDNNFPIKISLVISNNKNDNIVCVCIHNIIVYIHYT